MCQPGGQGWLLTWLAEGSTVSELLLACWGVGPRVSGCRALGPQSWCRPAHMGGQFLTQLELQDPQSPKDDGWGRIPRGLVKGPRVSWVWCWPLVVGLTPGVGGCWAVVVAGLVSTHQWVRPGPGAGASLLVGGAGPGRLAVGWVPLTWCAMGPLGAGPGPRWL